MANRDDDNLSNNVIISSQLFDDAFLRMPWTNEKRRNRILSLSHTHFSRGIHVAPQHRARMVTIDYVSSRCIGGSGTLRLGDGVLQRHRRLPRHFRQQFSHRHHPLSQRALQLRRQRDRQIRRLQGHVMIQFTVCMHARLRS